MSQDYVLVILCVIYMLGLTKFRFHFVPETRYISCTGLLFNKRKNVHIARCYSHSVSSDSDSLKSDKNI